MATPLNDSGQFEDKQVEYLKPEDEESEEIKQKIEALRQRGEPIKILVIGPTGVGKSTLINNLMGGYVAKVSHSMEFRQSTVEVHEGEHRGVRIRVYDTPGSHDCRGNTNSFFKKDLKGNFDLVLLCINIMNVADKDLKELLSDLKSNLHIELWKHLIVVFTFTNTLIQIQSLKKLPVAEKKAAIVEKITEFKRYMFSCISGRIDKDTFDRILFCTAGTGDDGEIELLFEENWLYPLWESCIDRYSEESYPFMMGYARNDLCFVM
uniref:G domain-containing protein n=1 Tax=Amphimedon queenslandica TaxID=400682 RepID=A0A1X7TCL7_AMPQE